MKTQRHNCNDLIKNYNSQLFFSNDQKAKQFAKNNVRTVEFLYTYIYFK